MLYVSSISYMLRDSTNILSNKSIHFLGSSFRARGIEIDLKASFIYTLTSLARFSQGLVVVSAHSKLSI